MIENGGTLTVEGRNTKVEIKLAEHAGFCFGVSRAANLIEKQADEAFKNRLTDGGKPFLYTVGELIHNRSYIAQLEKKGVKAVDIHEAF